MIKDCGQHGYERKNASRDSSFFSNKKDFKSKRILIWQIIMNNLRRFTML